MVDAMRVELGFTSRVLLGDCYDFFGVQRPWRGLRGQRLQGVVAWGGEGTGGGRWRGWLSIGGR